MRLSSEVCCSWPAMSSHRNGCLCIVHGGGGFVLNDRQLDFSNYFYLVIWDMLSTISDGFFNSYHFKNSKNHWDILFHVAKLRKVSGLYQIS